MFAAVIGGSDSLFYGLVDVMRDLAGWAHGGPDGAGLPWLALFTVPVGLLLSMKLRSWRGPDPGRDMVPSRIRASVRRGGEIRALIEARKLAPRDLDCLPVVESEESRRLLGLLGRAEILEACRTRRLLQEEPVENGRDDGTRELR